MRAAGILVLAFLAGCAAHHDSAQPETEACSAQAIHEVVAPASNTENLELFQETFHASVRSAPMNCSQCHSSQSARAINPPFADDSPQRAFSILTAGNAYINWDNPKGSYLVVKADNGHCGLPDCTGKGSRMAAAIQAWINAQNGTPPSESPVCRANPTPAPTPPPGSRSTGDSGVTLAALNVPDGLPVAPPPPPPGGTVGVNRFSAMTWSLDALGSDFQGARFSIQAQLLAAATGTIPGAYNFTQPRLFVPSATQALHVKGIHILVNGTESPTDTAFFEVDSVVTSEPGAVLLSSLSSGPVIQTGSRDQITIRFDVLQKAPIPSCKSLALFQQNVLGAAGVQNTMTTACLRCHGATTGSGYPYFQMTGTPDALCRRALSRTIKGVEDEVAYDSPLIQNPVKGVGGHPLVAGFNPRSFAAWINSER